MLKQLKEIRERLSTRLEIPAERIEIVLFDASSQLSLTAEEFHDQYNPEELPKGHCNIFAKVEVEGAALANFKIRDMVGCAGILVFHDLYVARASRRLGIANAMFDFVRSFAKHYGYALIQGTDLAKNEETMKLFEKNRWTNVTTFVNPKTKNGVTLWQLQLS